MAYDFGGHYTNRIRRASLISSSDPRPLTIAVHYKANGTSSRYADGSWSLRDVLFSNNFSGAAPFKLTVLASGGNFQLAWRTGDYQPSADFTADTNWHGLAATFTAGSPGTMSYWRDGSDVTGLYVNNTFATDGGSEACLGTSRDLDDSMSLDGALAHFACWSVVLDAAELAAVTSGVSPLLIRPASLVSYMPLVGAAAQDLRLGDWTVDGTLTQVDGPRILMPFGASLAPKATSSGATVTLDTGAVTLAGSDIAAAVVVTLDAAAVTVAGSDVTPATTTALDTGSIALAGSDVLASVRPVLDTGAVTVAGSDVAAATAVVLEAGALSIAGSDITAAVAPTLDAGAVTLAGSDVLAAVTVTLDSAAVTVAGSDVNINGASTTTLDAGAVTLAGSDVAAAQSVTLDTKAVTLAGSDVTPALTVQLDTGSIALAGADLTVYAAGTTTLDTGAIVAAGSDALASVVVTLDTASVLAAGAAIVANLMVQLEAGAIAVAAQDIGIANTGDGVFGPRQTFAVAFSSGQSFGVEFSSGQTFRLEFAA